MTTGIPGRPAPAGGTPPRSAPLARVSRTALDANLARVIETGGLVVDLRADAWGHGVGMVARAALDAGITTLLVDEGGARALHGLVDPRALTRDAPVAATESLYGLETGSSPVLSLHGVVLSTKPLRAGESVSYGYTHTATVDTNVALVTGGYAQGIVRALGNAASVVIHGTRHPIVGRVAMDVCVVDVGDAPVARGDEVAFFGDPERGEPSISEWSLVTGMSAGELVAAAGLRAVRETTP